MSVLEVSDLRIAFGPAEAVRGVSFDIAAGETVALVGESGSGKSLTALSTVKLLPSAARVTGSVRYQGTEMLSASTRTLRRVRGNDISFIFQEPMTSLNPLHNIERQITESLALHQKLKGDAARTRVLELLTKVGIREPETRLGAYPHQLSGGQRQRIMIAMALANGPKLLIADEPTTALDVTIQAQILDLLKQLQADEGLSMLFITHDLGIVRRMADRVCVMKQGEIVERGPTGPLFDAPQHAYTRLLLDSEPRGRPDPVPDDAPDVLRGDGVKVWFPIRAGLMRKTVGHVKAVTDVSVTVRAGQTLGVVGESGSGKTTLALAMMRLIASKGGIRFGDRPIDGLGARALRPLRRDMQVVFQDPFGSLSPRMSVAQIIAEGLTVHGLRDRTRTVQDEVAQALTDVGLPPEAMDRFPHEFSGGQRQRIAIARAMILQPKLVSLDEPTSALDMTVQKQIIDLLLKFQRDRGLAYLFISHDLKVVRAMAHDVIVMRNGEVVEAGPADQVFDAPQHPYTRELHAAALGAKAA